MEAIEKDSEKRQKLFDPAVYDSKSKDGRTPLWEAISSGRVENAQLLLSQGANPKICVRNVNLLYQALKFNNKSIGSPKSSLAIWWMHSSNN